MTRYVYARPQKIPLPKLPTRRAMVLSFIKEEIEGGRGFPSHQKISRHMGWKPQRSVHSFLSLMVGDGWLKRRYEGRRVVYELVQDEADAASASASAAAAAGRTERVEA
jgi:hypothetical protein